ncbi:S-adenosyl-L-methionine-dependent methyltransferase [Chlamydoabsidia padenii]|nr:S-adenosyl-L-methionine-dependent methyltransferase [Chlamydoabsidia padenii]
MGTSLSNIRNRKRSSQQLVPSSQVSSTEGMSSQEKSTPTIIAGRSYHNTDSVYWLPNDDAENDRLVGQHFAIKSLFQGNISAKVLDNVSMDDKATRVLDCGCGPGTWIMDVATEYPHCQLTGVDLSDTFPTSVRPSNVHFDVGNVLDRLPYEDNTFDFIHVRLFIAALRVNEWPIALKELYRILKPGGLIQSVECGQLSRGRKFTDDLSKRVVAFMQSRCQDPFVNSNITSYLKESGFEVVDRTVKDINLGQSDSVSREFLWDMITLYKSLKPFMAAQLDLKTDAEYDEFLKRLAIECQSEPPSMWDMTLTLARKPL